MGFLDKLLKQLSSDPSVQYSLLHLPPAGAARTLKPDSEYVRIWLRSAYVTEVRRWATKYYAGAHGRFELTDWKAGRREVLTVIAPDKTFEELDPGRLDRLITVNQPLLGPVAFRGELSMEVGLFSIPSENLAKPYLNLLADLTKTAGISLLAQAAPFVEPLRRGVETIFSADRAQLEIGVSRTDTDVQTGHWVVARAPRGSLPEGLKLDPNDFALLDGSGKALTGFPYMVIGVEGVTARDDYHMIPEIRAAWESVRQAAREGSAEEVLSRFAQLRRAIGLSSELISADKRRIALTFARELADAGFDAGLPLGAAESAPPAGGRGALRDAADLLAALPAPAAREARSPARPASEAAEADGGRRLSMEELQALMADPTIPDRALRRFFTVEPSLSQPFKPAVVIDPARVEVAPPVTGLEAALGMSFANDLARWRRQARFSARMAAGDARPVLVSEGDSWFQFPIFLEDVVDHLMDSFNIWSVDAGGDTLQNMVHGEPEFLQALDRHRGTVQAFLFSGGGNDILGTTPEGVPYLSVILKPFEAGQPAAWYLENPRYYERMRYIEDAYRHLLGQVASAHPSLPVICHGYDRAIPGGFPGDTRAPMWAAQDKWIGKPLRDLGITDENLQREIVGLIVDRFVQRLRGLCGGNNAGGTFPHAFLVDVRGVVDGRWADELHPTDDGYRAVAARFHDILGQVVRQPVHAAAAGPGSEVVRDAQDSHSDDREAARARPAERGLEAARPWRAAECLLQLRKQVDATAPGRSRASDGLVGDAAHQTRDSDHNPWVQDGGYGVVTAIDITHDPQRGCDAGALVQALLDSRDRRIKYVIWNRQICSSTVQPWAWRPYDGTNPHTKHVHISVHPEKALYDSQAEWQVELD